MWRKSRTDRARQTKPRHGGHAPPRLASWLLVRFLPEEDRQWLLGDLAEEFRDVRLPGEGRGRARRWYWGQALRSLCNYALAAARRSPVVVSPHPNTNGREAPQRNGDGLMSNLIRDIRYGFRTLAQTPTFTSLTILTLALAIGVNTAIFSMVNVLMFKPLPIGETDTIGFLYFDHPERGVQDGRMSPGDFLDYRERFQSLQDLAAVNRGRNFVMTGHEEPVQIVGFEATANTFDVWRLEPMLGRGFLPGEDQIGAPRVVLLAHGTWERRFGADPDVLGKTIKLNDYETTIVGVLGPEIEFGGLAEAELWVPLYLDRSNADRDAHVLWVSGRLADGVTREQAQQEATALAQSLIEEHPTTNSGWVVRVEDMNGALGGDQMWMVFNMLMLTVSFVLLIACSNIATMMLSRSSARAKEIAVRAALGAGRGRILRQLLAESLLLSLAAATLGLLITRLSLAGLVWMVGENSGTNFFSLLEIDSNVLLFTLVVALLAPLLFGFVPALRASRTDLSRTLQDSSRGSSGGAGLRGRRILVATQVSLALALMVVAGLLTRAMIEQRTFELGYDVDGIATLRIDLPEGRYTDEYQWRAFFDDALERIDALPGVQAAGWVAARPIADGAGSRPFMIEGAELPDAEDLPFAAVNVGTQGALDVLGLPVVRGRGFDDTDGADGLPVILVNEDMVQRYWNGDSPLGRRVRLGGLDSPEPWLTVVGVVGNTFSGNPDSPTFPMAVLPLEQNPRRGLGLVIRPIGEPLEIIPAVRREIWAIDADQPLGDVRTLRQIFADGFATADALVSLFMTFAAFALIMAGTGIYGVLSFAVAQRTQEIGIRMALGAHGNDVVRMISRQALWVVGIGILIGSAGAFVLGRIVAGQMPGVSAGDPWALGFVAVALVGAALLAIWIPARRAVRIDPIVALRQE